MGTVDKNGDGEVFYLIYFNLIYLIRFLKWNLKI